VKKIIIVLFLTLAGCGYQGYYRYPCQDPENWESKDCNPPVCKVDGACSKDLVGYDWEVDNDE
jgi:hypothetical protein